MFDNFRNAFISDSRVEPGRTVEADVPPEVQSFLSEFGGQTFNRGIYRVFGDGLGDAMAEYVFMAHPELQGQIALIGADWLGRVTAVRLGARASVMLLDPETGEVTDSGLALQAVYNNLLPDPRQNMLAELFHADWVSSGGASLGYDECASFKVPLMTGGLDEVDNLHTTPLTLTWHVMAPFLAKKAKRSAFD